LSLEGKVADTRAEGFLIQAEGKIVWSRRAEKADWVKVSNISGWLQVQWIGEAGHSDLGTIGGGGDGGKQHGVKTLKVGVIDGVNFSKYMHDICALSECRHGMLI
jgi:hypothetical protein